MSPIRVLLAPDKFKGSLSASEVAHWLETGLTGSNPEAISCVSLPLADGGDGSVQAALHAGFSPYTVPVTGPTGIPATTTVAFNGSVAVIEVATTSGLQMLPPGRLAPLGSSSVGFGQAIHAALGRNPQQVVLALGGSASTDGGAGMLSALGMRFLDASGTQFVPSGGNLADIARIDPTGVLSLGTVDLVAANDVQNPLLGPLGAASVYGPQKGATPDDVLRLEAGLANLVRRLDEAGWPGTDCAGTPGAGSAGGLGFAAMLLGARMASGADFFLDLLDFERALENCDLVVTGEGKMDEQTLSGKLPLIVARRAAPVPVVAVVGHNALAGDRLPEHGIESIHALSTLTDQDSASDPSLSAALLAEIGRTIAHALTHSEESIRP
ncbi:glycerate kinase [Arthrobacter sp. VKM Ac-2550]|uniref:glycerate kinase n=1 Tax=Crystallibacter permensis TaxID=1938888 RepID=UPI002225FC21|nr:glycerate kinase [Arthrobacter sp. VKM Ac-2550]MCW2132033.1 glycerate kinase [Arthrobacter sp. VKM Ac-2550]